jgi:hypothetical protein
MSVDGASLGDAAHLEWVSGGLGHAKPESLGAIGGDDAWCPRTRQVDVQAAQE